MPRLLLTAVVALALGSWLGYSIGSKRVHNHTVMVREKGEYNLIHPLLDCEGAENFFRDLMPAKDHIQEIIDQSMHAGMLEHAAVYYRDIGEGPWFGINEGEKFIPASLLKVPVMIAYLKYAETRPEILRQRVKFSPSAITDSPLIRPRQHLKDGQEYTIDQIIKHMIAQSDNQAAYFLLTHIDPSLLAQVYRDLGIVPPDAKTPERWMTVHGYASFFRVLFNASYLNKEMSQKALEYLTLTEFKDAIPAGVPAGVIVAHKFGERLDPQNGRIQLHDCGIVYIPGDPYILCVMTEGKKMEDLTQVIRAISERTYQEVRAQEQHRSALPVVGEILK